MTNDRRVIGGWELVADLGSGAFGAVYEARNVTTAERGALKLLHAKVASLPGVRARFLDREAQAESSIDDPFVVRVLECGAEGTLLYIVTAFAPGGTAQDLVSRNSALGPVLDLGADLFAGVAAVHRHDYVHRDVKPSNVLLMSKTPPYRGSLADFGFAKRLGDETLTSTGTVTGTVFFASPELLLDAKRAPRSVDLYAAAATLYYLLTAENPVALPTSGRQSAYLDAVRRNPRVPLRKRRPDVPEPIAATIDALVAIDASGRSSASPMDVSGLLRDTARRLDER